MDVMVFARWVVAFVTVAYALWNALPAAATLMFKFGHAPAGLAEAGVRFNMWMQAMPLWLVASWLLADLIYLFAALRLVSFPKAAFAPFALAFVLNLAVYFQARRLPGFDAAFGPGAPVRHMAMGAALGLGLVLYFAFSRVRKKRVQPTVLME